MEQMRIRTEKKLIFFVFMAVILFTTGCTKQNKEADDGGDRDGQQTVMGRYMEKEAEISEQMEDIIGIYRMSDEKLAIVDRQGKFLLSEDNGTTWRSDYRKWMKEKADHAYIMDAKMDSKGIIGVIYAENGENDTTELSLKCALLLPDETVIYVQFPADGLEEHVDRFWISDTGRYFVTTMEGKIYEVQEDGSSELYLMIEGSPQAVQFQGKLMFIDGYDLKAPLLYDMEKETYVEDEVLEEFVGEKYADRGFNGAGWQNMCLFPGEEGVIYLAGQNGLHRHVIGGNAMEQIINGRLSRLGSPQYGIIGMVFLDEGEFLAVSDAGRLINFTYDPNKEAVPQERLKIYSLEKNVDMYAAVSFYQIHNPDVFVEYEIGMEEGEAVTKEDAVKKLNARILAGEGPDILMLDGLPADSYMEKGLLCDLNDFANSLGQEMFENMFNVFEKEGKIYAIPGQVRFPVMIGEEDDVAGIEGLCELADQVERMRKELPDKDLIGLGSEKALMKICSLIFSQNWRNADGQLNTNAIEEYLIQTKRIYEAQMDGIDEKSLERLRQSNEYNIQYRGNDWIYDLNNYGFYMDYVAGYSNTYAGVSSSPRSYIDMVSVTKVKGFEDTSLVLMKGEEGSVFIPETILGINAATQKKELAQDFLRVFLGEENQCSLSGYAINRAAFAEAFIPEENKSGEVEGYGKVCIIYEDGREVSLDVSVLTAEEMSVVQEWMETAKIPYIEDRVFEECVFEEGSKFILGECEIEETLDAIERRLAIYMAE